MTSMVRLLPSLMALALLPTASAQKEQTPAELERSVLQELYMVTNGPTWKDNAGWADNTDDVCTWTGIECWLSPEESEGSDGRIPVIGIYLGYNFLSGRTPASLWKLPDLTTLDLSFNPALDVDFGSLADATIAGGAALVPPLESVNVQKTGTTSVKGVASLANTITELVLNKCQLESQFPPVLLELFNLSALSLSECSLRGNLPDGDYSGISQLSQLQTFDVSDNDLTGTLPEGIASLVDLRYLNLSTNQFTGTLPQFVNDKLVMLEQFRVNSNDFSGTIPAFDKQPSISKLFLNGNFFSGTIPQTFLEAAITGPGGLSTPENTIRWINLEKNRLTGILPESLDRLSLLPITWALGGNSWTDVAPQLCDNNNWNEGAITRWGCEGFMCPPQTYSATGFYGKDPCEDCSTSEYFGTIECFDQDDQAVLTTVAPVAVPTIAPVAVPTIAPVAVPTLAPTSCGDDHDAILARMDKVFGMANCMTSTLAYRMELSCFAKVPNWFEANAIYEYDRYDFQPLQLTVTDTYDFGSSLLQDVYFSGNGDCLDAVNLQLNSIENRRRNPDDAPPVPPIAPVAVPTLAPTSCGDDHNAILARMDKVFGMANCRTSTRADYMELSCFAKVPNWFEAHAIYEYDRDDSQPLQLTVTDKYDFGSSLWQDVYFSGNGDCLDAVDLQLNSIENRRRNPDDAPPVNSDAPFFLRNDEVDGDKEFENSLAPTPIVPPTQKPSQSMTVTTVAPVAVTTVAPVAVTSIAPVAVTTVAPVAVPTAQLPETESEPPTSTLTSLAPTTVEAPPPVVEPVAAVPPPVETVIPDVTNLIMGQSGLGGQAANRDGQARQKPLALQFIAANIRRPSNFGK